jgi:hypothetical protein
MAFLVRKLIKRDRLEVLANDTDIDDITADLPSTEFRTTNGALSTWKIESLEELDDAVLAIAVSSSEISKLDVIIIDTELVQKNGLKYAYTYAGMDIPIPDLQDLHCDIQGITIGKLSDCALLYRYIVKNEPEDGKYIVRYSVGEIKSLLSDAIKDNRIDITKANKKLTEVINKLSA